MEEYKDVENRDMRTHYPSNINLEQFKQIRPFLESVRKRTKPRKVNLYDVFCAILYILKSGCQWRMLPSDFPNWKTVYSYFVKWNEKPKDLNGKELPSVLEEVLKKISWRGPFKQWSEREHQFLHS